MKNNIEIKHELLSIRNEIMNNYNFKRRVQTSFNRDELKMFFKLYDNFYIRNYIVLESKYNANLNMYEYLIECDEYIYPKIVDYINKLIKEEVFDLNLIYNYEDDFEFWTPNIKDNYLEKIKKTISYKK